MSGGPKKREPPRGELAGVRGLGGPTKKKKKRKVRPGWIHQMNYNGGEKSKPIKERKGDIDVLKKNWL